MDDDYAVALKLQKQFDLEYEQSVNKNSTSNNKTNGHANRTTKISHSSNFETVDDDFSLALQLQEMESKINEEVVFCGEVGGKSKSSSNLADSSWELLDPNPDVRSLFVEFDKKYFWGKLASVEVIWSTRMTLCAGVCEYQGKRSGFCCIKLSEPLLKLRPRKDLLETLLHEMIHAYLFLTDNDRDRDGHGPSFQKHMYRLNKETGLSITIYHSFHDEVALYQQHWWRCDGPCKSRGPYYGYVKRAMNRPPSAKDTWWSQHQSTCGGTFTKIKEPDNFGVKKDIGSVGKKLGSVTSNSGSTGQQNSIPSFFKDPNIGVKINTQQTSKSQNNITTLSTSNNANEIENEDKNYLYKPATIKTDVKSDNSTVESSNQPTFFTGSGYKLGSSSPLSSMSKVLKDLHKERLVNLSKKMEQGHGINNTNSLNAEIDVENISNIKDIRSDIPQSKYIKNSPVKSQSNISSSSKFNNSTNIKMSDFFNPRLDSLNKKHSVKSVTKLRDVKTILSDASLKIGDIVRIPNFVSVSSPKHCKNKNNSFLKSSSKNNELKRKSDDNDDDDIPNKKSSKLEIEKFGEKNNDITDKPLNISAVDKNITNNNYNNNVTLISDEDDDEMCAFASQCEEIYSKDNKDDVTDFKLMTDIIHDNSLHGSPELMRSMTNTSSLSSSPFLVTNFSKFEPHPISSRSFISKFSTPKSNKKSLKKLVSEMPSSLPTTKTSSLKKLINQMPSSLFKKSSSSSVFPSIDSFNKPITTFYPQFISPPSPSLKSLKKLSTLSASRSFSSHFPFSSQFKSTMSTPHDELFNTKLFSQTQPTWKSAYSRVRSCCSILRCKQNWSKFSDFGLPTNFSPYFPPNYSKHFSKSCRSNHLKPNFDQMSPFSSAHFMSKHLKSSHKFNQSAFRSLTSYPVFLPYPNFPPRTKTKMWSQKSSGHKVLYLNLSLPVLCPSPTPSSYQFSPSQPSSPASSLFSSSRPSSPASSSSSEDNYIEPPIVQSSNELPDCKEIKMEKKLSTSSETKTPGVKLSNVHSKLSEKDSDLKDEKDDDIEDADDDDEWMSKSISSLRSPNNISLLRVVACPVCRKEFKIELINEHIDECLDL